MLVESVLSICRNLTADSPVFVSLLETLATLEQATPEIVFKCIAVTFEVELGARSSKDASSEKLDVPESLLLHFLYSYVAYFDQIRQASSSQFNMYSSQSNFISFNQSNKISMAS